MTDCGDSRLIDVLLVEDDEGDVLMTREAFEYYKIRNRLHVVSDGDQALQFLLARRPPPRPRESVAEVSDPRGGNNDFFGRVCASLANEAVEREQHGTEREELE